MFFTVFEKNVKYKIDTVFNDSTCIVLIMKSTLCCDNVIMKSRFVEQLPDVDFSQVRDPVFPDT